MASSWTRVGRREQVHLADDPGAVGPGVDDEHVLGCRDTQADLRRREVLARPVPALVVRLADVALLGEEGQQVIGGRGAESLAGSEGQLEGGRPQVCQQHVDVLGVQAGLLRAGLEQVVGVGGDVPVEGSGARDEDGHADLLPSAGPADLLPGPGDGARIAGDDRHVEPPDVDAQLQGGGAHDAQDLPGAQAGLDGAPLRRQVAAPVAAHAVDGPAALAELLPQRSSAAAPPGPGSVRTRWSGAQPAGRRARTAGRAPTAPAGRRSGRRRMGGSRTTTCFSPDGAPLRSMTRTCRPVRVRASSPGLPTVAEQHTNRGVDP